MVILLDMGNLSCVSNSLKLWCFAYSGKNGLIPSSSLEFTSKWRSFVYHISFQFLFYNLFKSWVQWRKHPFLLPCKIPSYVPSCPRPNHIFFICRHCSCLSLVIKGKITTIRLVSMLLCLVFEGPFQNFSVTVLL